MKPSAAVRVLFIPFVVLLMSSASLFGQFRLEQGGQAVAQVPFVNPSGPSQSQYFVLQSTTGSSINFTAAVSVNSGGGWLSVKVYDSLGSQVVQGTTGSGNNSVEVHVETAGLAAGTYNGTVTFQQAGNPLIQLSVPVTLTIGAGSGGGTTIPGFTATPNPVAVTYTIGSTVPTQTINVYSNTGTQFTYFANVSSGSFLSITSGASGTSAFASITLGFNVSGLAASTTPYTGNITIAIQGQTQVFNIPVSLTVSGTGSTITGFTISPTTISLSPTATAQSVTITPSNPSVQYTTVPIVTSGNTWLNVLPTSLTQAGTQNFQVYVTSAPATTSVGTVRFYINTEFQDITVTYNPSGTVGGFSLSTTSIALNSNQLQQTISINSTSQTTLYSYTTQISYQSGNGWLSVSPAFNANAFGTQALIVQANPTGLTTGTYSATLGVYVNSQLLQNVSVSYTVAGTGGGSTIPGFTFSPTAVNLNASSFSQLVTITPANLTQVFSYNASVVYATGSGWVTLGTDNGQQYAGPHGLNISVSGAGLTQGSVYSATVKVFIGTGVQDISVTYTAGTTSGGGTLSGYVLSANSLSLSSSITSQPIYIYPTTGNTAAYSYFASVTSGSWLSVNPIQSTTPVSGTQFFNITANVSGLSAGTYNGNVRVTIGAGYQDIPVSLTVSGSTGGVSGFTFSHTQVNLSPSQTTQIVTITPQSAVSYSYSVSVLGTATSWLSTNTTSGGPTTAASTFQIIANPATAPTGFTTAFVRVTINSQPLDIVVYYSPSSSGGGSQYVSPSSLSFTWQLGQASPPSQFFSITAPQGYSYQVDVPTATADFLRIVEPSTPSGTTTGNTLIYLGVQQFSTIAAGTYTAQVRVRFPGSSFPDSFVSVTLNVTGSSGGGTVPGYSVNPSFLTFNYTPGSSVLPAGQMVVLTTPQSVNFTLNYNAIANNVLWLTVSPASSGFTSGSPATTTLNIQPTGAAQLPVGTYTSTIQVYVSGQLVANIPVTLNVGTGATTSGSVAPSALTFTHQVGAAAPPSQLLTLRTSTGTAGSFTATASTSIGSNWLSVTPSGGNAPGAVAVSVNPLSLSPGTYSGTVTVTFSGSGTTSIPITLIVASGPALRLNLNSGNFNYQIGGSVPAGQAQNIELTSVGGPLSFNASAQTIPAGGTWLSVTPSSGSTPTTASIGINAANLPVGTYTGTVTFTPFNQAPVSIPVTLTVSSAPLFNTTPTSLSFSSAAGSTPSPQTVSVSTTGASVTFTATTNTTGGLGWLSAIQTVPGTISVGVNPAGLTDGNYYGAVIITSSVQGAAANSPTVIPVSYQVGAGGSTGVFSVQPANLVFTQVQGGSIPPSQSLTLGPSIPQLSYSLGVTTSSGGTWLSASPSAGITPATVQVSVNGGSLPLGTYSGTITASATGSATQSISVTLNVVSAPVVTASPTQLTFTSNIVGVAPGEQSISLTSSGANLNYTASATVGAGQPSWLEVFPSSGTTPASLTVRANITNLQQGTYSGTITVNLGLASPISIPVTFNYGAVATPQITSITNAASFLPTAAAPGMIVAIFGSNLGPTTLQQLRLTSAGLVDTNLNGVRVLFDNIPAPIVYARNDVVSAIVPYAMAGRASASLVVEYQGVRSTPLNIRVVDASPGIFTTNQQGSGQGAILNSNYSLNGPNNPVVRGDFVTVYLTGEGQTAPAGVDGAIASANTLRNPTATVQVRVGDRTAQVIYAGSVPTTVLGLCQVSFFVPADAPTGNAVPVQVTIAGAASQTGVSMAIR